jgi:hypothetical protein
MPEDKRDIEELLEDDDLIERALCDGVRDALRQHKLAGNPVPIWENGQVVWIQPQDIDVDS